jgi:hypothetical protein
MFTASAHNWVTRLRQPARAARLAAVLWIAWAVIAWNVVFDHVLVVAARGYLHAAGVAAQTGAFVRMDDWMRPAVANGLWIASVVSAGILGIGLSAVYLAVGGSSGHAPAGRHAS